MDRGAWWATVHGVTKELNMIEQLYSLYDKREPMKICNLTANLSFLNAYMNLCRHSILKLNNNENKN